MDNDIIDLGEHPLVSGTCGNCFYQFLVINPKSFFLLNLPRVICPNCKKN